MLVAVLSHCYWIEAIAFGQWCVPRRNCWPGRGQATRPWALCPAMPSIGRLSLRRVRLNYDRATQIAASIGRAIAVLFGLMGLVYSPFLLFIALFVWLGATQEAALTRMKSAVGGIPVHQVMVSEFKTLATDDSLQRAAELTLAGTQKDFPVVSDGILEGVLRQTDLLTALSSKDASTVLSTDVLDTVITKLSECRCDLLPVTREGKLVGVVTTDNLGAFMRLREASAN